MAMGLWLGMPGIRGLGEAGVGVESLAKDGAEVGIGDNDAAEVESFGDGSLTEDRVGAKSLAEDGPEVPSVDEYAAEIESLTKDSLGVKSLTEEGARVRNLTKDMPGIRSLGGPAQGSGCSRSPMTDSILA